MAKETIRAGCGTLADVRTSDKARIEAFDALDDERMRLISMGLRRGLVFEMKHNSGKGPVTVAFGNSRLALGRSLAGKIRVK
jgi:Fe2+ transport system protein FeoA